MSFSIVRSMAALSVVLFFLVSCANEDELETRSGLKVKLIQKGGETPVIPGGVAMINLSYATEDGRVLFSSDKGGGAVPVKMTEDDKGLLDEVVDILHVGDSVVFSIPAEDLYEKTFGKQLPDSIERGTMLDFNLGLENTFTMGGFEAVMEEKRTEELIRLKREEDKQLQADIETIDERLDKEGKDYKKLDSGVRIVVEKEGKGDVAKTGDLLNVHYAGRFFDTGEEFDASSKESGPLTFRLGSGVIIGWTKAFATLKEGSKATLYIPSALAYGSSGYQSIPPNSILVFDVELVKIEK